MEKTAPNETLVDIKPRAMSFPFESIEKRDCHGGNPVISAFGAALSSTFPPGEAEFIASVRLYRDQITDPKLQEQISGFIGQEGHHSHQHKRINEVFQQRGFDAVRLEKYTAKDIKRLIEGRPAKMRLAITVCMEHLTAIMAEYLLNHPEAMAPAEKPMRDLLYWHAVEEIEHKAVAFDVYMQCENDQAYLRRTMMWSAPSFWTRMTFYTLGLLWWSKSRPSLRQWKEFYQFLFGKTGLLRVTRKAYKEFFTPGFHPWDQDNRELIELWKSRFYDASCDKNSPDYQSE